MFEQLIDYVQKNLIFCIIVAVVVVAIIAVCIILIVTGKKKAEDIDESLIEDETLAVETDEPVSAQPVEETEETETAMDESQPADVAESVTDDSVSVAVEEEPVASPAEDVTQPEAESTEENETNPTDETADTTEEIATESEAVAQAEEDDEEKPSYSGKWSIGKISVINDAEEEMESAFFFQLKANNGEALLTSEEYTTQRGATQGIDTFKANIERGNFKISITGKGKYIVKLLTNQGTLLAQGEKYATRTQALNAINSIKRFATSAQRTDDVQVITMPYVEEEPVEHNYDPYKKGKWVVRKIIMESENDCSYCFELRASNGQVLFTSEEYSTTASLKNGIKTHKKNIENGNIRAVITRNGDYMLKIFAGNGQLLCLGNHYKTKQLCLSAIESVKRFADSAPLDLDKLFEE